MDYILEATELNETIPIYLQIIEFIKKGISSGRMSPGERLLSIREMSEQMKVNPNTVQRAFQELEREGVTLIKRGLGAFTTKDEDKIKELRKELSKEYLLSFVNSMKDIGISEEEIIIILQEYFASEGK